MAGHVQHLKQAAHQHDPIEVGRHHDSTARSSRRLWAVTKTLKRRIHELHVRRSRADHDHGGRSAVLVSGGVCCVTFGAVGFDVYGDGVEMGDVLEQFVFD